MYRFLLPLIGIFACGSANAAFIPSGVQNDTALSTVTDDWGWSQIYRDDYGLQNVSYSDVFDGHLDYIMIGGIADGSDTISVLAAIAWNDFNSATAVDTTTTANGAEWYNNHLSLGFAGLGATITQNSCNNNDVNAQTLCWHTDGLTGEVASEIDGGWNVGTVTFLNSGDTGWDKIVFTANAVDVPAPASLLLFASGLAGLGFLRRRKRA